MDLLGGCRGFRAVLLAVSALFAVVDRAGGCAVYNLNKTKRDGSSYTNSNSATERILLLWYHLHEQGVQASQIWHSWGGGGSTGWAKKGSQMYVYSSRS